MAASVPEGGGEVVRLLWADEIIISPFLLVQKSDTTLKMRGRLPEQSQQRAVTQKSWGNAPLRHLENLSSSRGKKENGVQSDK